MHSRSVSSLSEPFALLASRAASAAILVEEAIYDRLIELAPVGPIFGADSIDAQLAEIRAMMAEFRVALSEAQLGATQSGASGPSGPSGSQDEQRPSDNNSGPNRFNLDDVGYFDPFYESKIIDIASAIEYIDKSIFFRDIHVFIDRVKNIARAKGDVLLRQNLQIYLRDTVLI